MWFLNIIPHSLNLGLLEEIFVPRCGHRKYNKNMNLLHYNGRKMMSPCPTDRTQNSIQKAPNSPIVDSLNTNIAMKTVDFSAMNFNKSVIHSYNLKEGKRKSLYKNISDNKCKINKNYKIMIFATIQHNNWFIEDFQQVWNHWQNVFGEQYFACCLMISLHRLLINDKEKGPLCNGEMMWTQPYGND